LAARIKDVAKKASVSTATVSRVLNNKPTVTEENRRKVLKAIEELNYTPNIHARAFRMKRSLTVGMILPNLSNPHFPLMLKGAEEELRSKNYNLIIVNSDGIIKYEKEALNALRNKHVDGILFIGSVYDKTVDNLISKINLPLVLLGRRWSKSLPSVSINNFESMMKVFEYLYETGHRNYLYLGGPSNISSSSDREKAANAFKLSKNDVSITIERGQFTYDSGYERAIKALSTKNINFDAIVCANDLIAFGALGSCKTLNIKVPEEISVTGFDNIDLAAQFTPSLTTVDQNTYEIGRKAAELLLEYIQKKRKNSKSIQLSSKLIIRDSTIPRKK